MAMTFGKYISKDRFGDENNPKTKDHVYTRTGCMTHVVKTISLIEDGDSPHIGCNDELSDLMLKKLK